MTLDWRDIERFAAMHLGVIQLGLGLSVIAGGAARFPPPSYTSLLNLTNGQVWPYGLMFMAVGFMLLLPLVRLNFCGHVAGIVSMNVFAGLFFTSMVKDPHAAATAWWVYFSIGTLHGFNVALMHVRRKQHLYRDLEEKGGGAN